MPSLCPMAFGRGTSIPRTVKWLYLCGIHWNYWCLRYPETESSMEFQWILFQFQFPTSVTSMVLWNSREFRESFNLQISMIRAVLWNSTEHRWPPDICCSMERVIRCQSISAGMTNKFIFFGVNQICDNYHIPFCLFVCLFRMLVFQSQYLCDAI